MKSIWTTWNCQECNQLNTTFLEKKEAIVTCGKCNAKGIITVDPSDVTVLTFRTLEETPT